MSVAAIFRWRDGELHSLDSCDMTAVTILAADSWLVSDGLALALELHRQRFVAGVAGRSTDASAFWDAAIAAIPRDSDWFPRVELHSNGRLLFRLRSAPERTRSAALATWNGPDLRTTPTVKGPDLDAMLGVRTSVQPLGAHEAVLLSPDGFVIEGAYSGLLWWRGDILCGPPASLERVDSVTALTVLTLAGALGYDCHEEFVTPAELNDTELWVVSSLHGIRIATAWGNGPALAERPGRLTTWRARLTALRQPL
ncbi:MAG: aminotransferase class IV [Salinibacterium sp.]|nr:aminotransferase class IV [Salinibacterium sp.]